MIRKLQILLVVTILVSFSTPASSDTNTRFVKIDSQGIELDGNATKWSMVLDTKTGLYWEVKTVDESIHANSIIHYNRRRLNGSHVLYRLEKGLFPQPQNLDHESKHRDHAVPRIQRPERLCSSPTPLIFTS